MFFDIVILNPQHRGNFSHAWIAATRGVRFVPKGVIKELDISKLCIQIAAFITTGSTDPKKRFSLRLSSILLNGTIKIYREKVVMLQAEVITAIHTINIPSGMSSMPVYPREARGILETPSTPSIRVKKRSRGKKQVATPLAISAEPEMDVAPISEIPDVTDILQIPTATSDMITLREEAPKRIDILEPGEVEFGIITGEELEKEIMSLFPRARTEPVTPETPSHDLPSSKVEEVVALVHAEKGQFLDVHYSPPAIEAPQIVPEMPVPREIEVSVPAPKSPHPEEVPVGIAREVLAEITTNQPQATISEEPQAVMGQMKKTKDMPKRKVLLSLRRRPIACINRCLEDGSMYKRKYSPHISATKPFRYNDWFNLYWPDEEEAVRDEARPGSSIRISTISRRTQSFKKSSSLERDVTVGATPIEMSLKETPSIGRMEISAIPEISRQLEAGPVNVPHISEEPSLERIQPVVLEELLVESIPSVTELPSEIAPSILPESPKKKRKSPRSPDSAADYKIRQQSIVDILQKWNFDEKVPTIEDICEKPMTRLNMARAFYDLLVLCKKKIVILCSATDSIELEYIQLGPRLKRM